MIEYVRENFLISTDKSKLDVNSIHQFLSTESYWALNRPLEIVQQAIENSLCFGVYAENRQVGFARVVTDYATFAWVCDVYVIPEFRGVGLGKWLVECIVTHPDIKQVRRLLLATRDAHELYRQYGSFDRLRSPERWMEKHNPQPYEQDPEKKEDSGSDARK